MNPAEFSVWIKEKEAFESDQLEFELLQTRIISFYAAGGRFKDVKRPEDIIELKADKRKPKKKVPTIEEAKKILNRVGQ